MTEDEWYQKKKELKYLRERVRVAKKKKQRKELAEQRKKMQLVGTDQEKDAGRKTSPAPKATTKQPSKKRKAAPSRKKKAAASSSSKATEKKAKRPILSTAEEETQKATKTPKMPLLLDKSATGGEAPPAKSRRQRRTKNANSATVDEAPPAKSRRQRQIKNANPCRFATTSPPNSSKTVTDESTGDNESMTSAKARTTGNSDGPASDSVGPLATDAMKLCSSIFARDINWQEHEFDSITETVDSALPYDACPNGGPGGLICCAACTKTYSQFLSSTAKDMEVQKIKKMNKDVTELLGFLSGSRSKMYDALKLVKQGATGGRPLDRRVNQQGQTTTVPPRANGISTDDWREPPTQHQKPQQNNEEHEKTRSTGSPPPLLSMTALDGAANPSSSILPEVDLQSVPGSAWQVAGEQDTVELFAV